MEISALLPKNFPRRLKEIADPPKKLFLKGQMPPENHKWLCVVGSRKYSTYGKTACEKLVQSLSGYPIVIVSGLAIGIDSIAHKTAIQAGLKTVGVPGSGLNQSVIYPALSKGLAEKIVAEGGALISEFEPSFKATAWSFPQRNRIMAGLSDAILVIEAEKKSGTLITARLAGEYNRDVLAVPGGIFSPNAEGPNMLIRLGATPITNGQELLLALGIETATVKAERNYDNCSAEEIAVIKILKEPTDRETLAEKIKIPIGTLNSILTLLEIKGLVKEELGEIHLT